MVRSFLKLIKLHEIRTDRQPCSAGTNKNKEFFFNKNNTKFGKICVYFRIKRHNPQIILSNVSSFVF